MYLDGPIKIKWFSYFSSSWKCKYKFGPEITADIISDVVRAFRPKHWRNLTTAPETCDEAGEPSSRKIKQDQVPL